MISISPRFCLSPSLASFVLRSSGGIHQGSLALRDSATWSDRTLTPHRASARVDSRLVPDQEPSKQIELVRSHLAKRGFDDIELNVLGGYTWSQNSVASRPVRSVLSVYRQRGYEPLVWPRYPGSHNEHLFTRELGLAAARGGLGHGGNDHADDEYIVVGRQGRVAGIVEAEASMVDILMTYAAL